MVGITGQNQTNATCPVISRPRPDPEPCAFSVDKQVADRVSAEMVKASQCENVTWPNGTGIGRRCDPSKTSNKSGKQRLTVGPFCYGGPDFGYCFNIELGLKDVELVPIHLILPQ